MLLTHEIAGDGPAVLLLASSAADARMWDPQWGPLAAAHRVLRCDFRGFGRTPLPSEPYRDADDVLRLLDELGIERVSVVGASFGGRIALELAGEWPDRVDRLVLLCAAADRPPSDTLRAFGAKESALLAAGDMAGATELNVDTWLGPEAGEEVRAAVRTMQRHAFDVQLAVDPEPEAGGYEVRPERVVAPTLVVSGAHDLPDFRETAVELGAALPHARHVELPWAGHLPSLERPAEVTALILAHLDAPSWSA
jgi:3-oxoadipate enol-lactonase